ncbi:MAG TPA: PhnD/SsuA/transferrin family substrate-binding protein [Ramlibacter sp.]|nr:PhnD/SsuA/transferrin family substrate-binding protein [Ramlibacter sp.]
MEREISRRKLGQSIALSALGVATGAWSQSPVNAANVNTKKPAAAAAGAWRLVVNEAVTGETNTFVLTSRYLPLVEYLEQHSKGRKIDVQPVVDIQRFLAVAKAKQKPELIFGKSVNQLAKLVRDQGYQPLVRRADPYKAAFIVPSGSTMKTLADAAKATIVMPDEFAATTAVARAELRRLNVSGYQAKHVKFQEAVAEHVKVGLGQVGVVNPTVAKKWTEDGGRVLAETQGVVNWSLLASPAMEPETVHLVRTALLAMNTQAPQAMKAIGVKEWAAAETKDYLALLDYTKE